MKKRIFALIASVLCAIMVFQSAPVYAITDAISTEEIDLSSEGTETEAVVEETAESIPFILGEVEAERTLDTKVFRMSDGSYTAAVYPMQVHYEESGVMKEIDYRFEEVTNNGKNFYETKEGPITIRIPETINDDSTVVFSSGEYSVSFSLSSIEEIDAETNEAQTDEARLAALSETICAELLTNERFEALYDKQKTDAQTLDIELSNAVEEHSHIMMSVPGAASSVRYNSVMNGIDLNYSISGLMLKEEIVLNRQASALKTFSFTIDPGELTPILNDDNSVSLNDGKGEEQLRIASPFMYDKAGAESTDIDVTLTDNGDGTYTYKLSPDKKWLGSAQRIYPVAIDPPVTDSSFYTVKDTTGAFASSVGTLANIGELNYLKVGKRYDSSTGTSPEVQAMLYSQLPEVITPFTNIVNAYLYMYSYSGGFSSCPDDLQINAYMITSDWNTSNVMENLPLALGGNGRADYTDVLDYVYFNDADSPQSHLYRFEITEAAQKWHDGTDPNYGIALRAAAIGTNTGCARFFDSTNTGEHDQDGNTFCPRFVYVYRDSKGIEDYWTFTSMEGGRMGTVGVNNYNGNVVTTQELVLSTGNNMPVSVSIVYSANSADNGSAGLGMWRTNYHARVETCDLSFEIPGIKAVNYKYCFVDSDGTRHYLMEEGDEHKDEDGRGLTLTVINGADFKYQIETKDHTLYKFDYFGRLGMITDTNGNFNYIRYASYSDSTDSRILYIEEGTDMSDHRRRTTLSLDSATGDVTVTTPEGSYARLDFLSATNRLLQRIVYEDNINTSFSYTTIGSGYFPSVITDGKGHRTQISYVNTVSKKASSIQWGTEAVTMERYQFTYGHNSTKVTDIDGRTTTLQFNLNGHTIGVVDHTSSIGQRYEFGDPGVFGDGSENKILLTSKSVYASENRMTDGGFNLSATTNSYTVYPSADGVTKSYNTSYGGNTGNGSMKLQKAQSCTETRFIYQSISGLSTGKYTLSAYVSTAGVSLADSGAYLTVNVFNADGFRTSGSSNKVTYTKDGEWLRLQRTIEIVAGDTRVNVGITLPDSTTGTVYIDDIQLEYNISGGAGSFNQLANSSLISSLSGWQNTGGFTGVYKDGTAPSGLKNTATVTGEASSVKKLSQTVNISGKKGDVFIAGAWAKADSVPVYPETTDSSEYENKKARPRFGLEITLYNGTQKVGDTFEAQYNSGCEEWQFLTEKVIADGDYTKAVFSFDYSYNTGTATVASPFFYRESYGQSYVYDEEGNIISATDAAETRATYVYEDNALTQSLSPTGTRYMYSNDDATQNTVYSLSNSGQKITFGYNGSGDATTMTVEDAEYITNSAALGGKACYIVNAKDGKTLKPVSVESGTHAVYASNLYFSDSKERWFPVYIDNDIFYFTSIDRPSAALSTNTGGAGLSIKELTYNENYVLPAGFKYKIVSNGDGSFRLMTVESNLTKALYRTEDPRYENSNSYAVGSAPYDSDDPAFKWYFVRSTGSGDLRMETSAVYDDDGTHLLSAKDALGNTTSYTYGSNGLTETVTDPKGNVTGYTYNNMERTTKVESGSSKVEYSYGGDLLEKISVDDGAVEYTFTHDSFGRKTSASVGNGTQSHLLATYIFTEDLLTRQNYGQSGSSYIDMTYDSLDRLIKKTYNGDASKYVEYLYDPNGNLYGLVDSIWGKKTFYEYDLASRINGVSAVDISTGVMRGYEGIRYTDGKGTVESAVHSMFDALGINLRTTNYTYTYGDVKKGQMPDVLYKYEINSANFTFVYDSLSRLQTRTLDINGTKKTESFTYKAGSKAGYTSTLVESMTDLAGTSHTYVYDENGNITEERAGDQVIEYVYDSQNRLVEYYDPVAGYTGKLTYDDRGNILEHRRGAYMTKAAVEAEGWDSLTAKTYTYGDSTWADLLTSYSGTAITYDELGNPLTWHLGRRSTLTWENGRQLTSLNNSNLNIYDFEYTAEGLRTKKTSTQFRTSTVTKTTEYYIVDGKYLGEVSTIGGTDYVIAYLYDENGAPAGINVNGTDYYFAKNLQGDVVAILDSTGAVIAKYVYDAWGDLISVKDANGNGITANTHVARLNPFRYRGYMYDEETGFYYLRSRYYDPKIGRFLNADELVSTGQGFDGNNMFAYCNNNPIMLIDLYGNCPGTIEHIRDYCSGNAKCETKHNALELNKALHILAQFDTTYKENGFDTDDLYAEQVSFVSITTKDLALDYTLKISKDDYGTIRTLYSLLFSFMDLGVFSTIVSIFDANNTIDDLISGTNNYKDYAGRTLYIEQGYMIEVISRVYIGNGYSASENQYIVYDSKLSEVYSRTIRLSYMTD